MCLFALSAKTNDSDFSPFEVSLKIKSNELGFMVFELTIELRKEYPLPHLDWHRLFAYMSSSYQIHPRPVKILRKYYKSIMDLPTDWRPNGHAST